MTCQDTSTYPLEAKFNSCLIILFSDPTSRPYRDYIRPRFTYHSFRYVEISGFPTVLDLFSEIKAVPFSQVNYNSKFYTSSNLITYLTNMLFNSVNSNFIYVPTNNPSSDARLGWLEPAGLFSETALYSFYGTSFYKKWLSDIRNDQAASGAFSNTSPRLSDAGDASPGSGFAPILITYNLYRFYREIDIVQENYDSNKKWIDYVVTSNPDFLFTNNVGKNEGDFANVNAETSKEVIATAYFAYGAYLMSFLAKALNKRDDEIYFVDLHRNVSKAFVEAYVNSSDGKIIGDTQTGYVVGLAFRIFPDELIPKAVQNLVDNVKAHDYHLTTGYVGKLLFY